LKAPTTIKGIKAKIKKIMPFFINETLDRYSDFYNSENPSDAKEFSAHHSACKSALAHIETLLKIARWSDEKHEHKTLEIDWKSMAENALNSLDKERDFLNNEEE
jgi:hypothetical protein